MYATVQDVRDLAPHVPINAQSVPPLGTVERWIAELEAIFNAEVASMGYSTPLTDAASVEWARQVVAHRVMARVMRSRPNPETDPDSFQRWADAQVKRLRDPNDTFELVGATKNEEYARKETPVRVHSNLAELDAEGMVPRRASRDMIF